MWRIVRPAQETTKSLDEFQGLCCSAELCRRGRLTSRHDRTMTIQQPNSRERYRKLELANGVAEVWLERAGSQVTMHTVHPNGSSTSGWERCDIDGCLGCAVVQQSKCLRHANVSSRDQYLSALDISDQPLSLN